MLHRCYLIGDFSMNRSLIRASNDRKKEIKVDSKDVSMECGPLGISCGPSDLRFDRLQPTEEEINCRNRRIFGRYIAREAMLDEEYWVRFGTSNDDCTLAFLIGIMDILGVVGFKRQVYFLFFLTRLCFGEF